MASIKKNFAYNILLNVSNVLFPFITGPYTARVLEPDGIGLASFAGSYTYYFCLFAGLGVTNYAIREISKMRNDVKERQTFVSQVFTLLVLNTFVLAVFYYGSIILLPQMREHLLIFVISGLSLLLLPFSNEWYFYGMERFGFTTSRTLIFRCISIAALFLFVKSKADLYIYMFISVVWGLGAITWNIAEMRRDGVKLKLVSKGIRRHYKPMLILFASTVAISIYTSLDILMLGIMTDYSEVGFYRNATSISKTVLAVVTSLSAVALPRVTYFAKQNDLENLNSLITKSFCVISFLAIPCTVGLICISSSFVPLFYGNAFQGAVVPLVIMSGVIIAIGFNNLTGTQILLGIGHDTLFLKCILVGSFSNFILNLVLIPIFGASGASASSVIAEFLILFVTVICVKKYTKVRINNITSEILKATGAALLFIPITIGINSILEGWPAIFAIMSSCAIVYLLSQKLLKSHSYELFATVFTAVIKNRK